MNEEMLPCPYCGKDEYLHVYCEFSPEDIEQVRCDCGVSGPRCTTMPGAIISWNRMPRKITVS